MKNSGFTEDRAESEGIGQIESRTRKTFTEVQEGGMI
jgi:hypothetical protein